ncbi:alpha/beta-hydrolase [Mollisia scopiformis]|uniref:Alpha/beta-hydrolase n=1 Tax=Mollisia scopiformis TaxID=149040 RepID=A0A194XIJ8_MOLSC|nr:alpha/beta-hydrolase [Mollisia scopiformis]KUJ19592.1 alpha/beta-hydrolase [Mollisia scopiformis]
MLFNLVFAIFIALSHAATFLTQENSLQSRDNTTSGISEDLFDKFKLFANFTSAAYCPSNELADSTAGTLITCPGTNCTLVEADNVTSIVEFGGSNDTTVTDIKGFVSLDPSKSLVVVAFAGSGSTVRDWIADFAFIMVEYTLTGCTSCWIHAGFSTGWSERRIVVLDAVTTALADNPSYSIVITGHSIGAAIATLAAAELRSMNYSVDTYTFGSPRVGDTAFATFVTDQAPALGNNYRMTHFNDPVPQIPPTWIGYEHTTPEYWLSDGTDTTNNYNASDVVMKRRNKYFHRFTYAHKFYNNTLPFRIRNGAPREPLVAYKRPKSVNSRLTLSNCDLPMNPATCALTHTRSFAPNPNYGLDCAFPAISPQIVAIMSASNTIPSEESKSELVPIINSDDSSSEVAPKLKVFTLFPLLPLELRRNIWCHTFLDTRYVCLDTDSLARCRHIKWTWEGEYESLALEKSQSLPVAMFVNSESRQEALMHYITVERLRYIGVTPMIKPKPLCFSIESDRAYISQYMLREGHCDRWFNSIKFKNPEFFDRLQVLDIRGFEFDRKSRHSLVNAAKPRDEDHMRGDYFFCQPLLRFKGLKLVKIFMQDFIYPTRSLALAEQDLLRCANAFFERHKEVWGGKPPMVEVQEYDATLGHNFGL